MIEVPFQNTDPKYDRLVAVLHAAYKQAAHGKGKERHANGLPYDEQPMQTISHLLRSEKGMAYQVIKKLTEGLNLPTHERRVAELYGAINYIAGIVIYLEDREAEQTESDEPPQSGTDWLYRAVDANGEAHDFTGKPEWNGNFWVPNGHRARFAGFRMNYPADQAPFSLQILPAGAQP